MDRSIDRCENAWGSKTLYLEQGPIYHLASPHVEGAFVLTGLNWQEIAEEVRVLIRTCPHILR